jgi:carbon storage regulator
MLVLSRKLGEQIVIDGNIRVTVVSIKGNQVRLGIEAPPSVMVDRSEVRERRQEFKTAAGTDHPSELTVH